MRYFAELDQNNTVVYAWVSDDDTNFTDPILVPDDIPMDVRQVLEDEMNNLKNKNIIEYSEDTSITNNRANIGFTYDPNLNAFIPPQPDPTYILDTQTFEWEPDENLEYDLHGDGKLYRYNKELKGWTPTWDPEES